MTADSGAVEFPDVPAALLSRARAICLALPETTETPTSAGSEFRIRRRTFANVFAVEDPAGRHISMLVCRADPDEREALSAIGHPFFAPRSGVDRIGVVLGDSSDWVELAELITESYRILAPKKLSLLVEEPPTAQGASPN